MLLKIGKLILEMILVLFQQEPSNNVDLPFKCYLCESSFSSRVECLQHQSSNHASDWTVLKEKNEIGNIQVFATRLDKLIEKLCKKAKENVLKHSAEEKGTTGITIFLSLKS